MTGNQAPLTLVGEVMLPIRETLHLTVQDSVQDVMQKGLYTAAVDKLVVIFDGPEVIAVTGAGRLRGQVLPRSWSGRLGDRLGRLPPPPEITPQTRVAALDFLVQEVRDAEWLLVVDDETGHPLGVLSREVVLDHLPPVEPVPKGEIYRGAQGRLWGDPEVEHVFYYCQQENRRFGSHAVHPDAQGRMRDRKGHLVEEVVPPQMG
jgi:CBS domain-containing protein